MSTTGHHHAHGPANRRRRVLRTAAPLFVRFPHGVARAAAVVLHDVPGLTGEIEDCCRALARCGYVTAAPYLYYECGGREFRPDQGRTAMSRLTADDLAADIGGALDHLRERVGVPPSATAVLGVGMGGHLATWAAAEHRLAAAVAHRPLGVDAAPWPGAPSLPQALARLRTPWLGLADAGDPLLAVTGDAVVPRELGWWDEAVRFIDARVN
ncbi:dienelactone hydrolase family protein [Saccharopolyspora rosea]|uniref:Dienelactone hydrolase family protein n=1 Tax=Saccharopolyspora rosea TaxID=524884 RepID=A0ABW3FUX6_9PSEU|nr:dienelactone hydrolase family protein [Saccharopolyspora rosea]